MVNRGVPERVAMTITGHKTRAMFDRYHIVSPGDLQEAARKLTGTVRAQTPPVEGGAGAGERSLTAGGKSGKGLVRLTGFEPVTFGSGVPDPSATEIP